MEFLLINHPLDCPICDKGGECPLQNQAMSNGRSETRFVDVKRTFPKPINISAQVLLDRERCVLCARCTRFSDQVAGDPFIEMLERGALQQVGIYEDQPFDSYFSGNTVQICPVGALTSAKYRFRARPFDLVSTPTVCEHCSSGCALRVGPPAGHGHAAPGRRRPRGQRGVELRQGSLGVPLRDAARPHHAPDGPRRRRRAPPASWPEALDVAARGLAAARVAPACWSVVGSRSRTPTRTRSSPASRSGRTTSTSGPAPHSAEEADFLAAHVAGTGLGVTYRDLEQRTGGPAGRARARGGGRHRLPPAAQGRPTQPHRRVRPGRAREPRPGEGVRHAAADRPRRRGRGARRARRQRRRRRSARTAEAAASALRQPGAVIMVGERLGALPGALSAAVRLAAATGARLAWLPRRAGERAAVEAGAMPGLLPGGRPLDDARARGRGRDPCGATPCPTRPAGTPTRILAAAAAGELDALVVGGVEVDDLPDPDAAQGRARRRAVPGQPRAPDQRCHRPGGRRASRSPRTRRRSARS